MKFISVEDLHSDFWMPPPRPIFFTFMQFSAKFGSLMENPVSAAIFTNLTLLIFFRIKPAGIMEANNRQ